MRRDIVSIEWHDLDISQLMYIQAVVMPELVRVINQHMDAIEELRDLEENK